MTNLLLHSIIMAQIIITIYKVCMDQIMEYFYIESFVRMRHQCALYAKNSVKRSDEFKGAFCSKWEDMMQEKRQQFRQPHQKAIFERKFYHPSDLAYQILRLDALKLLQTKPRNKIKKSVWKNIYGTIMPRIFEKMEIVHYPPEIQQQFKRNYSPEENHCN